MALYNIMRTKNLFRVVKNFFSSFFVFGRSNEYMEYDEFLKAYKNYMEQEQIKQMVRRWQTQ